MKYIFYLAILCFLFACDEQGTKELKSDAQPEALVVQKGLISHGKSKWNKKIIFGQRIKIAPDASFQDFFRLSENHPYHMTYHAGGTFAFYNRLH